MRGLGLAVVWIGAAAFAQRHGPAPARPWAVTQVQKNPRAAELAQAGREALEKHDLGQAIQKLSECTAIAPESYVCAISLGLAYAQLRDRSSARYWLERGSRLKSSAASAAPGSTAGTRASRPSSAAP